MDADAAPIGPAMTAPLLEVLRQVSESKTSDIDSKYF
jgi:hypothetical protein